VIAGILLASGASRRFGSDKLLAPLGARAVIRWSADALGSSVDTLYVVVPVVSEALEQALDGVLVRWVTNGEAYTGMSSSIRAGIAALDAGTDAAIVALGDQPLIDHAVVARLVARWREGGARAVAPLYEDGRGHPVLFGAWLFPALRALEGDHGARAVLDALGDDIALVPIEGRAPTDVDTPAALETVAAQLASRELGTAERPRA
jgi:molybdenum cofactor cytidylyltransferase